MITIIITSLHFINREKLADCVAAVSEHIIAFSKGKNKSWLKPIPLFHFLAGVSEPYQPLPYDHTDIKWILWNNIKKIKKHFRDQFTDRDRYEKDRYTFELKFCLI